MKIELKQWDPKAIRFRNKNLSVRSSFDICARQSHRDCKHNSGKRDELPLRSMTIYNIFVTQSSVMVFYEPTEKGT
jgi:hypothetical protein